MINAIKNRARRCDWRQKESTEPLTDAIRNRPRRCDWCHQESTEMLWLMPSGIDRDILIDTIRKLPKRHDRCHQKSTATLWLMPSRIDRDVVIDAIWRRATTATDVIAATASRGRPALTTSEKGRGRVTAASSFDCDKRQIHRVVPDISRTTEVMILQWEG